MNCQEFAEIVNELAGQRLMDAVTRQRALRHAQGCALCAARLAAENELTVRLRAFAEDTQVEQAPARVRESLRAVFAEHQRTTMTATVAPMPARRRWINTQWAVLAAAAVLVLFAVAVSLWLRSQSPQRQETIVKASPTPTPEVVAPAPIVTPPNPTQHLVRHNVSERPATARRAAPRSQPQLAASASNNEIATNYIPLTYTPRTDAPQDGMVVRVEVARSTLLAMGLPLNAERSNELIKADVMMSSDGVPLAIRLVQR